MIIHPKQATLKRYGMTNADWDYLVTKQGGVCAVCERQPKNGRLVTDHEHVKNWRKMPAKDRKRYVRGLLCNRCNWRFLPKGMTASIAVRLMAYLVKYDSTKTGVDSQASPV